MPRTNLKTVPVREDSVHLQDFLDMISPSVIKFNTDHFICGNTFRCMWALGSTFHCLHNELQTSSSRILLL